MMKQNTKFDILALLICIILAVGLRLPGLTRFITADEARSWYGRSIIFLDSLLQGNFMNTAPGGTSRLVENVSLSPAPGVTTMWAGTAGILLEYLRQGAWVSGDLAHFLANIPFDPLDPAMLFSLRLPVVLAAVLAVGLTFWWGRPLLGRWGALLAAGLLALDPFYLALSRVLGHDALVATFMWLSLLAFLRGILQLKNLPVSASNLKPPHLSFLLFSGGFAGLAFLSKYPALFIGMFIAVAMLFIYIRHFETIRQALIQWIIHMVYWSVAAGLVVVLFWPAMWIQPVGLVTTIIGDALRASGNPHQKGSFFLGQPVPDPGMLFYPLIAWLRSTPVVVVGVVLSVWQLWQVIRRRQKGDGETAPPFVSLSLWAYILLYTLLITLGGKKQDRYLLPAFPAMALLAAVGYVHLAKLVPHLMRFKAALPIGLLLLQLLLILPSYPYYFSYYNPLAGGARSAAELVQVGWGEGLDQAAEYLNTLPDIDSIEVTSWYSTTFEPYFAGQSIYKIDDEKISRSAKPGLTADYVVFYINQVQRRLPSDGALAYFRQNDPAHTVTLNGLDYAWIYRAPGVAHIIGDETRLVGQAELLGFDWFDQEGRPITLLPSNSVAHLRLYWEWQGKTATDPLKVSLVDDNGYTWGWGYARSESMQGGQDGPDGQIMIDEYDVAVFPGTPPGQYYLQAWIEQADGEEVIGRFPLSKADSLVTVGRPLTQPDDFEMDTRLGVFFGPLELWGQNFSEDDWNPTETRNLELFWRMPDLMENEAMMSLALVNEPGAPIRWEQQITPSYPTSQWQEGDRFRQVWPLTLPSYVPKGDYELQLTVGGVSQPIGQVTVGGRDRLFEQPSIPSPLKATVGESIELLGYQFDSQRLQPGTQLPVTLFWQAKDILPEKYTVFVQLIDANQQVVAQHDSQPKNGTAPTDSWAVGEYVVDEHLLDLPPTLAGEYRLIVGMYRPDTGERLPINTADGETDAWVLTSMEFNAIE